MNINYLTQLVMKKTKTQQQQEGKAITSQHGFLRRVPRVPARPWKTHRLLTSGLSQKTGETYMKRFRMSISV